MKKEKSSMGRVSVVIIRDKKLLLVTGYNEIFYWTPGGKVKNREEKENTLKRELNEELKIKAVSIKPYLKYKSIDEINKIKTDIYCYLVSFQGIIRPSKEITKYIWMPREDIKKIKISEGIVNNLIPKLIKDNLI